MKTLYLVRHAKSSWSDPTVDDRDRPLNKRGRRNAPQMAQRLAVDIRFLDEQHRLALARRLREPTFPLG